MSLAAVLAPPSRERRPPGRPRRADAPTERDFLKALRFRAVLGLTEREAAGALNIDRNTLRDWCKRAYALPAGKSMMADD